MNNEIIDVIGIGILILIVLGGSLMYVLQVAQEMRINEKITKKRLELLDTKILKIKSRIRR